MLGKVKCRQSVAEPCRTTRALVNAANDMVMAAIPTHTPVFEAAGERSPRARAPPSRGVRSRQPPPELIRSFREGTSILGGS